MSNKKVHIKNTEISGDFVLGDKTTIINNQTLDYDSEIKPLNKITEEQLETTTKNLRVAALNFKGLNPDLDLKILQTDKITNFIIDYIGPNERKIGDLIVKDEGTEKLRIFIEDGIDITLDENEFTFNTDIKGLPEFAEYSNQKLLLKYNQKIKITPIKLILHPKNNDVPFEILTNLHFINVGTKRINFSIKGLQFIGEFKFYLNYKSGDINVINLSYNYDTIKIDNLIKTNELFINISNGSIIEIFSISENKTLLEMEINYFNIERDLEQERKFLLKYQNVIMDFGLNPVKLFKLEPQEQLFIELLDTYLKKSSISINYQYPIILKNEDDTFMDEFRNKLKPDLNLSTQTNLKVELLGKIIEIGECKIYFTKPVIKKLPEQYYYELQYEKMIYDFKNFK